MGTSEEVWPSWMETYGLYNTFGLGEWSCRVAPGKTMDQYLTCGLNVVGHCCKVITFRVPYQFANNIQEFHLDTFSSFNTSILYKVPADELLFLIISCFIYIVILYPFLHLLACLLGESLAVELGLEDVDEFFVGH